MPDFHSKFAPSGAKRWVPCARSHTAEIEFYETYGEEPAGPAAVEGARKHDILESVLKNFENPKVGLYETEMSEEDRKDLLPCIDAVCGDLDMLEAELYSELRMQSGIDQGLGGTADVVVVSLLERRIAVTDYKNGVWGYVPADEYQLQLYGHMAVEKFGPENFDTLVTRVVQPRYKDPEVPVIREAEFTVSTWFPEFRKTIIDAINAATGDNPPAVPGPYCRYCKGNGGICPRGQESVDLTAAQWDDIPRLGEREPEPEDIHRLRIILDREKYIMDVFKQAKSLALHIIDSGHEIEGYEVTESIGNRKWNPDVKPDTIARNLRSRGVDKAEVWVKSLISPTQAIKAGELGDKFMEKFIVREVKGKRLQRVKKPTESVDPKPPKLTDDERKQIEEF